MKKILTTCNQKGGNGKSSLVFNLAYELGEMGKSVLVIDFDPQATLGKILLTEEALPGFRGIEDLLLTPDLSAGDFIISTPMRNVSIIPSHNSLAGVASKLLVDGDGFFTLKSVLSDLDYFDYIIVDTPGNLEFLTLSAMIAGDGLIIPIYPALYSLLALNDLMNSVEKIKKNFGAKAEVLGVLLTMMDRRANYYLEVEDQVRAFFGGKVFKASTSRTVKIEEASLKKTGVSGLFPESRLAGEFKNLTGEILSRLRG